MLDSVVQRNTLLSSIERERNSAVIAYVLHDSAVIADDALPQVYDKLESLGGQERIDLLLYTRGGVPEVCWRLLNLLREYCEHLGVIVATRVQGAGTLLALGADEVVMGPLSELGGVEAIRNHPLLPHNELGQQLPISLGEIRSLLDFLTEHSATSQGAQGGVSPEVLTSLFQYINPLALASMTQGDVLSRDLTRKALRLHMDAAGDSRIAELVDLFNGGFRSPLYTAGRNEVRDLGLPVTFANGDLWNHISNLLQLYQAVLYSDRPDTVAPGAMSRYVCMVESNGRSTGLRQTFTQADGQERVLQIRWETAVKGPGPGPAFGPGGISHN